MLTVKKIYAGRGAVDYYLNQTRRGLADYYVPQSDERAADREAARLSAPGSSWWGGGANELGLAGEVERGQFVPLYAKGVRPDGGYLGTRFRQPEEAAAARATAMRAADEIEDPYDRWMTKHEIRRTGRRASVAAWDCTFSPPKSVSLLWAAGDPDIQRQVWVAHTASVDAGLGYLEEHAAYVRAGRNGVRVLDTGGLVVSRMNEWTSRDGDMHLHTHCLVLNRAQTVEDGKWRALDGRALLSVRTGAGAIYNRTVEAELTRRLGVAWRDRPDGLRELEGVDDELIETFSSRRRAITERVAHMAAAFRDKYGFDPPPAVLSSMGQDAWGQTRDRKREPDPNASLKRWEAAARRQGRELTRLPDRVIGRTGSVAPHRKPVDLQKEVLGRLADSGRSTFTRHDLLRACLDVLPPGDDTPERLQERAEQLVSHVVARPELIGVSAPDLLDAPGELRRADGTSVYEQPERDRWALHTVLDQEAWLLDVAPESTGHTIQERVLEAAVAESDLGGDQQSAVRELLGSDKRIGVLIGPAGAGKTRTLRAVVDAWQSKGSHVVGLTVSQAAADVLSAEAQVRAENTAKWLYETRRGRWHLPHGALVLIDEASMVATKDLVELVEQARRAGGRVLLVGDPAQLSAIHIGGAFDLLADRHGGTRLHEIRRFTDLWERDASMQLRRRDPACLAEYAMRGRIHGDTRDQVERDLFEAWTRDAVASAGEAGRRSVLMIVSTNEQAAVLSERAREALLRSGEVSTGRTARLRDNVASVGDHIVTRRNDRRLRTSNRRWVVNGDVWTVLTVHADGAVDARRHADGSTITLPTDYLAQHTHLAYATTAHRAQGMTVDVCHAAITPDASHEQLYVAATRGRHANHLWATLDADRDVIRDAEDLPTPERILTRVLQRRDLDRLSAHQIIEDSLAEVTSLARLGGIFEDAARTATGQWLRRTLGGRGLSHAADEPEWASLLVRVRQAALDGHDLPTLIDAAVHMRPIEDAHSTAAVLHWRLDMLADTATPSRARGPLASLPPGTGPEMNIAHQAGELMRQRWRDLRATIAVTTDALPWAAELGPAPADPAEHSSWLTAATAVTAYRERYEVPGHIEMLGPRPTTSRPDAGAAWHHARSQADSFLARRLRHLDHQQLADLDSRQQAIIASRPQFNPATLEHARRVNDQETQEASQTPALAAEQLEVLARRHLTWRMAADEAASISRQIQLEQRRRHNRSHRPAAQRAAR